MMSQIDWKVLPHKPIQKVTPHILRVEGQLASGPPLTRVMTVIRLETGELIIHSAIALDENSMREIESFGTPAYLFVPNHWHRLDARGYLRRYPQLKVFCPFGARSKVEEMVPVHGTYSDFPSNTRVHVETLEGIGEMEGVLTVTEEAGSTLIFNDALFNMPHQTGLKGFILRHITGSSGGPRVSRLFRLALLKDRTAFRRHLEKLSRTPDLKRLIVSHHEMIENNPQQVLQEVARKI